MSFNHLHQTVLGLSAVLWTALVAVPSAIMAQGEVLSGFEEFSVAEVMGPSNPTSATVEEYDSVSETWVVTDNMQFSWDAQGRLSQLISTDSDMGGELGSMEGGLQKVALVYNTSGDMTSITISFKEDESDSWADLMRVVGTYNASEQLTEENTEMNMGLLFGGVDQWVTAGRNVHEYTEGKRAKTISYEGSELGGQQLRITEETVYTYDASGNLIEKLTKMDMEVDTLVNSEKYEYTYEADGERASEAYYSWSGSAWIGQEKYLYTKIENVGGGYSNVIVSQVGDGGGWENDTRDSVTYTADKVPTGAIEETWNGSEWVQSGRTSTSLDSEGRLAQFRTDEYADGSYTPVDRMTLAYEQAGIVLHGKGAMQQAQGLRLCVRHNVLTASFMVGVMSPVSLCVRDIKGRRLNSPAVTRTLSAGTHSLDIPLNGMAPGHYVLSLRSAGAVSRAVFSVVE
ncbi:MAG: hypothetical protein GF344_11140 [Chitinivibrionales bacterium]|nr:hypothetical protein [Chitinivibrionales bacterium]MBD3357357.1 hypothetical protein [Chitinivibrionales bacterium]